MVDTEFYWINIVSQRIVLIFAFCRMLQEKLRYANGEVRFNGGKMQHVFKYEQDDKKNVKYINDYHSEASKR